MNLRKYIISISVCLIFIFVLIGRLFIPIQVSAELTREEVVQVSSYAEYSCLYTYNNAGLSEGKIILFKDLVSDYTDFFICSRVLNEQGDVQINYYCGNETITAKNGGSSNYNKIYVIVGSGIQITIMKYADGSEASLTYKSISKSSLSYTSKPTYSVLYMYFTSNPISSSSSSGDSSTFFTRLWNGLKNMWYGDTGATVDFWFGDDNIVDYWNNIGDNWCNFVKTTLGIDDSDTSTLNTIMDNIYNNDYSSDYWTNIDNTTITTLQYTSTNLKNFWENNVNVVNDDGDYNYHYEIKNYNPVTNTYPSYLYNNNYFYENILYQDSTNLDDTNNWLQKIYNAIIDLPSHLHTNITTNVTNTYNYLFVPSDDFWDEWNLKFNNTLDDKFPIIQQVEDFTNNVGDIINSYSESDFAVGSISEYFSFDNDEQPQTLSIEDDISNIETSYTGYVPKISIDLSKVKFIGYSLGDGKVIVMDFVWYLKYRPLIFTIIIVITYTWFIISLGKSLPRLIGNVADIFDYRQDVEIANSINEYNESAYYFSGLAENSKE